MGSKKMKMPVYCLASAMAFVMAFSVSGNAVSASESVQTQSSSSESEILLGATAAEQEVYDFAKDTMGLNTAAACGIMGNAKRENDFGTGWDDPSSGSFYGMFQWNSDGYAELCAWCAANGKDSGSISGQMSFMYHELTANYSDVLSLLRNVPDTAEGASYAGYHFSTDYEQPGDDSFSSYCGSTAAEYFPLFYQTITISENAPAAERLFGDDRYLTAEAIAHAAFPDGAYEAVLVSGESYADALSAGGLAGAKKVPILITEENNLPEATQRLISGWGVKTITVVGGTGAVSEDVVRQLEGEGIAVSRVSGDDRFLTAKRVFLENEALFRTNSENACIIASGLSSSDALSISPWAYACGMPLFLTSGDSLDAELLVKANSFSRVYIVGGEGAVSREIEEAVQVPVSRFSGEDRYATSALIAEHFSHESGTSFNNTGLASGNDLHFADALIGCMLEGQKKAPIILADGTSGAGFDFIRQNYVADSSVKHLYAFGGTGAISDETVNTIRSFW